MQGKIYFIGAGPGDPELLTLKAHRLMAEADLLLYAGSLVPTVSLQAAKTEAQVVDSSSLTLEQCHTLMRKVALDGGIVARIHTGDPSLYGTIAEQARLLEDDGIEYEIVPGVTSACAAAAAAKISFTIPEVTQSLVLTRMEGRTPMPKKESISNFAALGCSMAVYLSAGHAQQLQEQALCHLPEDTLVLCAYRVGWPEQKLVWTSLNSLVKTVQKHNFTRQTLFLLLPGQQAQPTYSRLYAADFLHGWRQE